MHLNPFSETYQSLCSFLDSIGMDSIRWAPESTLSYQSPNLFFDSIGMNTLKSRTGPCQNILGRRSVLLGRSEKFFRRADRGSERHRDAAASPANPFAFSFHELWHRKRAGDQDAETQFGVAPERQPSGVVRPVGAGAAHGHAREIVNYHNVGNACSVTGVCYFNDRCFRNWEHLQ